MCTPYPKRDTGHWLLDEPVDEQNRLTLDRDEEAARIERWCAFVAWLKGDRDKSASEWATLVWDIQALMYGNRDPYYVTLQIQQQILDFKDAEGWSGVFSALARAMKEQGL